jgi:hypothetical protein
MNQLEHANNMEIPSYRTGLHEGLLKDTHLPGPAPEK